MSLITQYSRISHHTIYGLTGSTFSVPTTNDFTDGSWTIKDLALSEIGVNEGDKKVYIRIDDEIKEFQLAGGTSSTEPLSTTLVAGNTTGANWIKSEPLFGILSEGIGDTGYTYSYTIKFDPIGYDGGTSFISTYTDGEISTITQTPTIINLDCYDGVNLKSGATLVDASGVINNIYTSSSDILLSSSDIVSTITDTIILDPYAGSIGYPRTGIKSENATTGQYSNTIYTPLVISSSVNNLSGENTYTILGTQSIHIGALNGADEGYTNYTKDTIISQVYNDTPGITDTISIDPKVLGNGTGIKSDDGAGNISYTKHTPDGMVFDTSYTDGGSGAVYRDYFTLDPKAVLVDISSEWKSDRILGSDHDWSSINLAAGGMTITAQSDDISSSTFSNINMNSSSWILNTTISSGNTDIISTNPSGIGYGTGITSIDATTGNQTQTLYTPNTIISTATDVASTITDNIGLDPQGLGDGTGISSTNTTTGDISQTIYTPNGIDTSVINPGTNQLLFGMSITPTPVISLTNDNAFLGDISTFNLGYSLSTLTSQNTTTGITDTLSIDPEGLGNGTGIKSENTTTGDYSNIVVTPTFISIFQDDVTNGQVRYISLGSNAISLIAGPNAIVIDESSQSISLSTDKISIGSSNVKNIISTGTVTTTNATITTIHIFTCVNSGPKSYKVRVVGNKSDYSKAYLGELFGLYNYDGATVTLIGSLDLVEKTNFTTATSTISISGATILVRVTGEAATTINWSVYVEMNDNQ